MTSVLESSATRSDVGAVLERSRPPRRGRGRPALAPYAYIAPALAVVLLFTLFPAVYTVYVSFTNYDLYHYSDFQFIGLANFTALVSGIYADVFLPVLAWTAIFSVLTTILNYAAGLALALVLNRATLHFRSAFRTLLIIPWAIPSSLSILIWQGLMNQSFGPIDHVLISMHLPSVPWLTDPFWAKASVLLVNLWLGFPFFMVAFLGGLQSIDQELYDAAAIDGARPRQVFGRITFPLLWRFSLPLFLATFAFNFNNFGIVYLLTGGGPPSTVSQFAGTTDTLSTVVYNMTLHFYRYGLGAAFGLILFFFVAGLSLVQFLLAGGMKTLDAG
jgi:arabinogalactan oligomer/maltooligosaccharide transport system permease protein